MIEDISSNELSITIHSIRKRGAATINGEIAVSKRGEGTTQIDVGNTGLKVIIEDRITHYELRGDFMPEGRIDPGFVHPLKAMSILSYSIEHLKNFLISQTEFDLNKIHIFKAGTNEVFSKFLTKLFAAGGHPELISDSQGEHSNIVEIDFKAYLSLPENDDLVQKIQAFSRRAEGMKFQAMLPVETSLGVS